MQIHLPEAGDYDPLQTFGSFTEDLPIISNNIITGWLNASFSEPNDQVLKRYFCFHFREITNWLDELKPDKGSVKNNVFNPCQQTGILLLSHLLEYYHQFLDGHLYLPKIWVRVMNSARSGEIKKLETAIGQHDINKSLSCIVNSFLNGESSFSSRFTVRSLTYYQIVIAELNSISGYTEQILLSKLIHLNFNDLRLLSYLESQKHLYAGNSETLCLANLICEKKNVAVIPGRSDVAYDPNLMDLKGLYTSWLSEQISFINADTYRGVSAPYNTPDKLVLNTSVAHLAAMIRFFHQEDFFRDLPINEVLKFVSQHFSTKKRPAISFGSLTKEFYSVTQSTAARVKGIFDNLNQRIIRDYFPK